MSDLAILPLKVTLILSKTIRNLYVAYVLRCGVNVRCPSVFCFILDKVISADLEYLHSILVYIVSRKDG